jgi:predicted acylesterase/phospholipase RssA
MFSSIVISGGAMKVLCSLGCIKYLEEKDMLSSIKNFVGTSAGAMICFFLVLGYKSTDINTFLANHLSDPVIASLDPSQVLNILNDYGISDGSNFIELMKRILFSRTRLHDITFIELAKMTGKNLVVCVSNLTDEKEEFFCIDSKPNMSVIQALRISCSIPIIFNPVTLDDKIYLDGALYNNFPMNYFKNNNKLHDILGINIAVHSYKRTDNILLYILYMVFSLVTKVQESHFDDAEQNVVTIKIDTINWIHYDELKISYPEEKVDMMIKKGYEAIQQRLEIATS